MTPEEEELFFSLVFVHRKKFLRVAHAIVPGEEDDMVQDALLRIMSSWPPHSTDGPVYIWALRILQRICFTRLKRRSSKEKGARLALRISKRSKPLALEYYKSYEPKWWLSDETIRGWNILSEMQKELLWHIDIEEDWTYKEAAMVQKVAPMTVGTRVYRARNILRSALKNKSTGLPSSPA